MPGWISNCPTHTGEIRLADGQHTLVVEYYEHGGEVSAHAWWQSRETFPIERSSKSVRLDVYS
jgi:hypothetical protein